MKEMGAQIAARSAGMLRGQAPFDLAQAQAGLKVFAENAQEVPARCSPKTPRARRRPRPCRPSGKQGRVRKILAQVSSRTRRRLWRRSRTRPPSRRRCRRCFRIAAPATRRSARAERSDYLRGRPLRPPVSFGEQRMRKALIGLVALAILGVLGFLALTSPSAYRLIRPEPAAGCRPHSGCGERPHPVLRRRLHLLPCGSQSGRQAEARRRLCAEIPLRHLPRSQYLAAQAGRHRLLDA